MLEPSLEDSAVKSLAKAVVTNLQRAVQTSNASELELFAFKLCNIASNLSVSETILLSQLQNITFEETALHCACKK